MKNLAIALVLALIALLAFGTVALAGEPWDVEDPCVAANEDFINGWGSDDGVYDTTGGVQEWAYTNLPNEGYSLYRDDVTDTGNLDTAAILTFTPGKVDLPIQGEYHDCPTGVYWKMGAASPDTWYWATEPRGYNKPAPKPSKENLFYNAGQFDVILCSTAYYGSYKWEGGYLDGKILRDDLSQVCKSNGDYYRLDIPAGTEITSYGNRVWGLRMRVSLYGEITFNPKNIQFSNVCSVSKGVDDEWVEVVSFTEIAGGEAIQLDESAPASIYPGSYTIANNVVAAG